MICLRSFTYKTYMMPSKLYGLLLLVILATFCVSFSHSAPGTVCGQNEILPLNKSMSLSRDSSCQDISTMACDACLDCSPCVCKTGFIRASAGGPCISEKECHDLHLKWSHDTKYLGEKNTFCQV